MNLIKLVCAVFLLNSHLVYSQWVSVETGYDGRGRTSYFTDSLHGSIGSSSNVNSDNYIITTFNGGNSWTKFQISREPTSIFYSDSITGYCVTSFLRTFDSILPSEIYKTIDGGLTWSIIHSDTLLFTSIYFLNNDIGFIGGLDYDGVGGVLKKTYNGGDSWEDLLLPNGFNSETHGFGVYFIKMLNDSIGFFGGNIENTYKSEIWKTNDGGENWDKTFSLDSTHSSNGWFLGDEKIDFINDSVGIVTGYDSWITFNQGESWKKLDIPAKRFYTISAAGNNFWLSNIDINVILFSEDCGATWLPVRLSSDFIAIYSTFFSDEMHGWLIGIGDMLKTVNGGLGKITAPISPTLIKPTNGENVLSVVGFEWEPINYSFFNLQISTDSTFDSILIDTVLITNKVDLEFSNVDSYFWRVLAKNQKGTSQWTKTDIFIITDLVSVGNDVTLNNNFSLKQNFPNPFNPTTEILYSISDKSQVELYVYNILGEKITTLVSERKLPGNYKITFNASSLNSGIYIYQLRSNGFIISKKMLLLK